MLQAFNRCKQERINGLPNSWCTVAFIAKYLNLRETNNNTYKQQLFFIPLGALSPIRIKSRMILINQIQFCKQQTKVFRIIVQGNKLARKSRM